MTINPHTNDSVKTTENDLTIPKPLVPLRLSDGTFVITITHLCDELGYGGQWMYVQPVPLDDDGSAAPDQPDEILQFEYIEDPDEHTQNMPNVRKIRIEQRNRRVSVPKNYLGEYGITIATENYDKDNPLVFFPHYTLEEPSVFYLEPLGHVSELFMPQSRFTPFPRGLAKTAAEEFRLEKAQLDQTLRQTRSLGPGLIDAPSVDGNLSTDYEPIVFDRRGKRYAIHFAQPGVLLTLFRQFYGVRQEHVDALHWMHHAGANRWLTELYKGEGKTYPPESGPVAEALDGDLDIVLVPISKEGRDLPFAVDVATPEAELAVDPSRVTLEELYTEAPADLPAPDSDSGYESTVDTDAYEGKTDYGAADLVDLTFPPSVFKQVSSAFGLEMASLRNAMNDIQASVTSEQLAESSLTEDIDREPLRIEKSPEVDLDEHVLTLVFVDRCQFPEALADLDIDADVADAVRSVHNRFAEDLIDRVKPGGDYRHYSFDSDAIVLIKPAE